MPARARRSGRETRVTVTKVVASCTPLYQVHLIAPLIYETGIDATSTTCDVHADRGIHLIRGTHHAHSCGRAQSRGAQRSPALLSLLLSVASPSREDAHRPGGGRAAQRALVPGLLRGAAQE